MNSYRTRNETFEGLNNLHSQFGENGEDSGFQLNEPIMQSTYQVDILREVPQGYFYSQHHFHPSFLGPKSGLYSEQTTAFRQATTPYRRDNKTLWQIAKQWNIKFTGRGDTIVIIVLDRVDDGRAIDFLSEKNILTAMPFPYMV